MSTAVRTGYQPLSACRRREKIEKENEIGESVVLTARDFTKIPKAVAENLKTDLDHWIC